MTVLTTPPGPAVADLPTGFRVRLPERTRVCDDGSSLVGTGTGTVLYLTGHAAERVRASRTLTVTDTMSGSLARRLLDTGLADPVWPSAAVRDDQVEAVTVVVPVRDRADELDRLLGSLPPQLPVVVTDDGSVDPAAVAAVVARHGARLCVHARNRGPAAARNSGLAAVDTPFVVFLDSDVVPEPGWLGLLRRHLDDPGIALVAPRVLGPEPRPEDSWVERYEQARSSLDLGVHPGPVRPGAPVSYLPSACLLARVAALGDGFDPVMRSGEDVDLVWRLVASGWRVRYEPAAQVRHRHRSTPREWLARKAFYGSSAADLAARHGDAVAPMVLAPWSTICTVALLAQRRWSPLVVAAAAGVTTARVSRRLGHSAHPVRTAATLTLEGLVATVWQTGAALTRHHWPLALVAAAGSRRVRRAVVLAAVVDAAADYRRTRPRLDPVRYALARRLDDLAYGTGVWAGVLRRRDLRAVAPRWCGLPSTTPDHRRRRRPDEGEPDE